jgi:SAM-dependent MidA family methyltransferase
MTLQELLNEKGRMTYSEFMQLVLYHPEIGFYAKHMPGTQGQFQTSPSLSPWFGKLLLRQFVQMHKKLATDGPFSVVEVGAGSGHLAFAALSEARTRGVPTRWVIVERFDNVKRHQKVLLAEFPHVSWANSLSEIDPVEGCLVLNEVIDNAPVNVLEVTDEGVKEVFLTCNGPAFSEELGDLSDSRLKAPAERAERHLNEGDRFEVSLGIDSFVREITSVVDRGFFLTFDYGDEEPHLWTNRPAGSMVSYAGESLDVDVLRDPGQRDITSHVNFSHLARALSGEGWSSDPLQTQRDLLLGLGAEQESEALRKSASEASGADALRLISERSALTTLYRSGALGDLKALIARRGI